MRCRTEKQGHPFQIHMVRAVCSFCGSQPEKVRLCRSVGLPHTKMASQHCIAGLDLQLEMQRHAGTKHKNATGLQIPTMTGPGRMQRGTRDRPTFSTSPGFRVGQLPMVAHKDATIPSFNSPPQRHMNRTRFSFC